MKKLQTAILAAGLASAMSASASITTTPNATITAIFGSGNPNGGWQEVTDTGNNIQLGLRAKERYGAVGTHDGSGNYTLPSPWNIEFSVNVNADGSVAGPSLASTGYSYLLNVDGLYSFDLATILDNSYGNSSTANSAGVEGLFSAFGSSNSIMQNSEQVTYTPGDGSGHSFDLSVQDGSGNVVLNDRITVNGGYTPVPEPSTVVAGALLLLPFGVSTVRMLRKSRKA